MSTSVSVLKIFCLLCVIFGWLWVVAYVIADGCGWLWFVFCEWLWVVPDFIIALHEDVDFSLKPNFK